MYKPPLWDEPGQELCDVCHSEAWGWSRRSPDVSLCFDCMIDEVAEDVAMDEITTRMEHIYDTLDNDALDPLGEGEVLA